MRPQGALECVMINSPNAAPLLMWLTPALLALLLYGLGQGFVKMWITEVPPARFCLYFACARALVMICYFIANPHTPVFAAEGRHVLALGVLAYVLDGTGWIMYFQSIIAGPITIVGTLSAAYPALTIVFAHWFLGETLTPLQYGAVVLVIGGCVGLAYQPADAANKVTGRAWIALAFSALVLWGAAQTIVKYDYSLGAASGCQHGALQRDRCCCAHARRLPWLMEGTLRHAFRDRVDALFPADGDDGVGRPWGAGREPLWRELDCDAADRRIPSGHARLRGARGARREQRIILLQWGCIAAILVGMYFCTS